MHIFFSWKVGHWIGAAGATHVLEHLCFYFLVFTKMGGEIARALLSTGCGEQGIQLNCITTNNSLVHS